MALAAVPGCGAHHEAGLVNGLFARTWGQLHSRTHGTQSRTCGRAAWWSGVVGPFRVGLFSMARPHAHQGRRWPWARARAAWAGGARGSPCPSETWASPSQGVFETRRLVGHEPSATSTAGRRSRVTGTAGWGRGAPREAIGLPAGQPDCTPLPGRGHNLPRGTSRSDSRTSKRQEYELARKTFRNW